MTVAERKFLSALKKQLKEARKLLGKMADKKEDAFLVVEACENANNSTVRWGNKMQKEADWLWNIHSTLEEVIKAFDH